MAIAAPVRPASLLRRALAADAVVSGAAGALQLAAAGPLSALLALDAGLLRGSGLFLLLWTAFLVWVLGRKSVGAGLAWTVIGLNLAWAAGSVALWLQGAVAPNALGLSYLLAQAAAVAVFAELQFFGLRRQQRGAA
ncbi:hypothetical protein K4L06_16070 [Lysobacter sp. BMK333-48F3]|uniref:hypothetical protein n=1 Tax=Lysobacter sp. BMK333-48F3 TaxID=2867962 RepID=UPI001C8C7726|nr:hypothetical protein [Lysobacter sp. BMK333-48F3]MBX9402827.1 hypothetical protein [Lysobacter sp. BMK333-48F3]